MTISLGYIIFTVPDVSAALVFYRNAFDLEQKMLTPERDYGELATGAVTLAFVAEELSASNLDAAGGFTRLDPNRPPVGASVTLLSDDVPAAVAKAAAAGATVYVEPTVKPWGQTVAYLVDPSGVLLEVATPIAG